MPNGLVSAGRKFWLVAAPPHYSLDFNNVTFKIHLNQNTLDEYTVLSA
jgi:hypothetical protein